LQIGDPAVIAARTGIATVADFRAADVATGGQGAPLVPYPDWLMYHHPTRTRALQNIGGIANVTHLPAGGGPETVIAFDTGPGNVIIDGVAACATGGTWRYDRDGALAAQGRVDETLLAHLLDHPYLRQSPPKSTGRETFGAAFAADLWGRAQARGLTPADLVATVTAFTAASIADAYRRWLPAPPDEVFLCGGGADNPTLVRMLRERLAHAFGDAVPAVRHYDETGYSSATKEAVAFAILAYETWHSRPGNLPQVTGASRLVVLGHVTPAPHLPTSTPSISPTPPIPLTEEPNPATAEIDTLDSLGVVRLINREDHRVAEAVATELEDIATAVDSIVACMERGGRLIYVGAGTSGRLGVLDASECPPTFNTPSGQVVAGIAGGELALREAVEGAEDNADAGRDEIAALAIGPDDVVVGITASGRTPYVLEALREARRREAFTVGLTCNRPTPLEELSDVIIAPLVGPEVIAGSTRMKAGTAQKMVLNALSTAAMIRLGKTYGNLMVDVQPTNAKLRQRAQRIVALACGLSMDETAALLASCSGETKTAIVAGLTGVTP
ncbi:MAG: N-acetylmuramic acid 6-phosphate etherase, partial [Dehalococcoidia bacterium]